MFFSIAGVLVAEECVCCTQAALEIRQLKDTVAAGENRVKELVQQVGLHLHPGATVLVLLCLSFTGAGHQFKAPSLLPAYINGGTLAIPAKQ